MDEQPSFLSRLLQSIGAQRANPAMLGSGAASQAAQIMQMRPYKLYMQEAQAMGQQPLTPEQWFAQQQGGLLNTNYRGQSDN